MNQYTDDIAIKKFFAILFQIDLFLNEKGKIVEIKKFN